MTRRRRNTKRMLIAFAGVTTALVLGCVGVVRRVDRGRARAARVGRHVPDASRSSHPLTGSRPRRWRTQRAVLHPARRQRLPPGCRRRARRRVARARRESRQAPGDDDRHPARHVLERRQDQRRQHARSARHRPTTWAACSASRSRTSSTSTSRASLGLVDGVGGVDSQRPDRDARHVLGCVLQPGRATT